MLPQPSSTRRLAALTLFLVTLGAADACAKATYTYTGQDNTTRYPANGCLSETMHLGMSVTFPKPLAANLNNQSVQASAWVIKDGEHLFKDSLKHAIVPLQSSFTTDAAGKITGWSISSYYYYANGIDVEYTTHSNSGGDYAADYNCKQSPSVGSSSGIGVWTKK